jgi:hypothetical protein
MAAEETANLARAAEAERAAGTKFGKRASNAGKAAAAISSAGVGAQEPTAMYSGIGAPPRDTSHIAYSEEPGYDFTNPETKGETSQQFPLKDGAANPVAPKTGGFTDEDYQMMGLNLLASPGGMAGNALSQLGQNLGRAGIATLGSKKEREKTEFEKLQKQALTDYYKGMTENLGREPDTIRQLRALQADPKLMETMMKMEAGKDIATQRARLIQMYETGTMMGTIDPATMSLDQFLLKYGGASLGGNANQFKVVGSRPS